MDIKGIRQKIKKTVVNALANTDYPCTDENITTERLDLESEHSTLNIRLKVQAGFQKHSRKSNSKLERINNSHHESLTVAMVYQNRPIGEIEIVMCDQDMDGEQIKSVFERIATDISFFLKRQQVSKEIESTRHLNVEWIGNSERSKQVDRFVEKASAVDFPVLIIGESGSGKLLTAFSIHCHSKRKPEKFIESHCANWSPHETLTIMQNLWSKASGGTLYLRDIDSLTLEQLVKIRHYWRHVVDSDPTLNNDSSQSTRLITSATNLSNPERKRAWRELDCLSIQLPNLRDRRDDIRELTEHYLEKLSYIKNVELSADCWQLLEQFDWSGNIQELERLVSKLVVMTDSNFIEPSTLLAIIPQLKDKRGEHIDLLPTQTDVKSANKPTVEEIARLIAADSYDGQIDDHPALSKAIFYLANNFTREINLQELSENSFVSPSHLSYLFKHHLNSSFKQLLIHARIEKAQILLLSAKHKKVTEIAYDVGFHDLSHFEKTFKRLIGSSPGQFRKLATKIN